MWAIVFGHFGACWGYYTLFTGMPTYFKDVLDFDIEQVDPELTTDMYEYNVSVVIDLSEKQKDPFGGTPPWDIRYK